MQDQKGNMCEENPESGLVHTMHYSTLKAPCVSAAGCQAQGKAESVTVVLRQQCFIHFWL